MPKFTILSRKDAWVVYAADVEAPDAQTAVDLAYQGLSDVAWEPYDTVEFDAALMVALDEDGKEIESTIRGKY